MAWNPPQRQQPGSDPFANLGAPSAYTGSAWGGNTGKSQAPDPWGTTATSSSANAYPAYPPSVPSSQSAWPSNPSNPATQQSWPNTSATQSSWPTPAPASNLNWSTGTSTVADPWASVNKPSVAPPQQSLPQQASTAGNVSGWSQAAPSSTSFQESAWPTASNQGWNNGSFNQQAARPAQTPQASFTENPFGFTDPQSGFPPQQHTSFQNTSYASQNNSFQSASYNPFDVTNDDAGFFSNTKPLPAPPPQKSLQKQNSSSSKDQDIPPPSVTTQRLMRTASMLFERGLIIKADKLFIQELVLRGDRKAEQALEVAERDGNLQSLNSVILAERKKESGGAASDSDSEDERAEAAAASFKKRPSVGRKNSDDDDNQTEVLTSRRDISSGKEGPQAPHPTAGGYTGTIPADMLVKNGNFVGTILVRISSKKMFRKWKSLFFAIDMPRLSLYENRREWEMSSSPKLVFSLHECMWIAKPTLKKTYSLIDDGRRVYFSTLKENAPSVIRAAAMAGMEKPASFSPALEARVVAKFGSYYPDEISAFAHALYSVILAHQREAKSASGTASPRRQTSGFGGRG